MTTVYKVVRKSPRGVLWSAIVYGKNIRLRYKPGEPTLAKDGMRPLAFENLEAAQGFAKTMNFDIRHPLGRGLHEAEVWEADATEVAPLERVSCEWTLRRALILFWESGQMGIYTGTAPKGSVSCASITLTKRIDNHNS